MPAALQVFVAIFVVGASLRSFSVLTKVHAERLATLVFSVCLPATILVSLDQITLNPTMWKLPVAACLVTLPLLGIAWLLARLTHLTRPTQGGFIVATGLINSVYFSYPVVLATFGEEGLAHAVLFDVGQSLLTFTVVYGLAVWFGAGGPTAKSAMARFFSAPPLWALCGILVFKLAGLSMPSWLHQLLTPVHLTTTPLASLVLGLSISFTALRHNMLLAPLGVAVRMGGGLVLGLIAAMILDLTGLERAIVILVAAMPSAVNAVVFATEAHLDEDLVASIVALSICIGIAVLPWLPRLSLLLLG
ncbi:MAG TPA: AEC family transporter [Nitrospiraceae bacterium]|nr:AEC family transporter [Nitrospiraceae bacterium]